MVLPIAPHVSALPGPAIFLMVAGFNLMGASLRDALDPKIRPVRFGGGGRAGDDRD